MDASHPGAVSRRRLLTAAATAPFLPAPSFSAAAEFSPDPVLPLWREWRALHSRAAALCRRGQRIETQLMRQVGIPRVRIASPDQSDGAWLLFPAEIEGIRHLSRRARAALHAELTAQQARWEAAAEALGFEEIKRQEIEASDQEAEQVLAVFAAPATSLAGLEAKLALMLHLCRTGSEDPDFPAPQLRSTLADARRLRQAAAAREARP